MCAVLCVQVAAKGKDLATAGCVAGREMTEVPGLAIGTMAGGAAVAALITTMVIAVAGMVSALTAVAVRRVETADGATAKDRTTQVAMVHVAAAPVMHTATTATSMRAPPVRAADEVHVTRRGTAFRMRPAIALAISATTGEVACPRPLVGPRHAALAATATTTADGSTSTRGVGRVSPAPMLAIVPPAEAEPEAAVRTSVIATSGRRSGRAARCLGPHHLAGRRRRGLLLHSGGRKLAVATQGPLMVKCTGGQLLPDVVVVVVVAYQHHREGLSSARLISRTGADPLACGRRCRRWGGQASPLGWGGGVSCDAVDSCRRLSMI